MHCPAQDRSRVVAVISALKVAGIRVKNWKNYLERASSNNDPLRKESQHKFAFGRELSLLPQCNVEDAGGPVSKFLVDVCEFLTHHLHTEGLFRKTGSLSRIRSLRAGLEQGHLLFSPPYSVTLQPCDVASLLKQFLRELPSPLIPMDLQGPLCLAQCLEEEEGSRDEATLLLTALFPPIHTRALRYLCTFLRQAAERCDENRMEVGNLALVIAPNLLQCPAGGSKLTAGTERQLDRQAAVIKSLITNADRIGDIPFSILSMSPVAEGGASVPPAGGGKFQERTRLGVYRSLKRQKRRSVGEIFVDALTKLKTGLTAAGPSNPTDSLQNRRSPTPQSPGKTKRKSIEDPAPDAQGSAKKRRSIQDLRENNQPVKQCSDDFEASIGQSHRYSPVSDLSEVGGSREEAYVTLNAAEKSMNQKMDSKIYNRLTAEEDKAQRRRTLRFFNMTTWNTNPNAGDTSIRNDEKWMMESKGLTKAEGLVFEEDGSPQIPIILIEGPGRGVVENELEDDPDLLDYSFLEIPTHPLDSSGSPVKHQYECSSATLGDKAVEQSDEQNDICHEWGYQVKTEVEYLAEEICPDKRRVEAEVSGRVCLKPRPPRRSLSMPEVNSIHMSVCDDPQRGGEMERCLSITQEEEAPEEVWPVRPKLAKRPQHDRSMTSGYTGMLKEAEWKKQEKKEKQVKTRMSVTDRLRRFTTMAMLLRPVRSPTPPPEPLLEDLRETVLERGHWGGVRLRRQGARRFGRSISHDGVPAVLEPDSVGQQGPKEVQAPRQAIKSAPSETTMKLETSHIKQDLKSHPTQGEAPPQQNILQSTTTQQPPQQENNLQITPTQQPPQQENKLQITPTQQPPQLDNNLQITLTQQPPEMENNLQITPTQQPPEMENNLQITPTQQPPEMENNLQITPTQQPPELENNLQITPTQQPPEMENNLQITPTQQPPEMENNLQITPTQQPPEMENNLQITPTQQPPETENNLQITPTQPPQQTQGCQEELRESPGEPEDTSEETDLHDLLQTHLNLCDSEQVEGKDVPEQLDRQTQTDTTVDVPQTDTTVDVPQTDTTVDVPQTDTTVDVPQTDTTMDVPQQIMALVQQDREVQPSLPTPLAMHLYTETYSFSFSTATQTDRATPQDNYHTTHSEAICSPNNISALDFIAVDMDKCSFSLDITPPALPFRSPGSRRAYRDSPRWHVHEISMATGDPLHI